MDTRSSFPPAGPQICEGKVMHARLRPSEHRFVYPVAYCLLPLHALGKSGNGCFGLDRFNLLSFYTRDHGPRDGTPLLPWFAALYDREMTRRLQKSEAVAALTTTPFSEVWLQCFPRVLGYVFNPVSFWYGYRADGALMAILAEVSNTFGEHHNYLLAHDDGRPIVDGDVFTRDKVFHVSPFFPVRGHYSFRFHLENGRPRVRIDYADERGDLLRTALSGVPRPLNTLSALNTFLRYPLLTVGVMARIHWQAARLYFGKRVPFFRKPAPPIEETTS